METIKYMRDLAQTCTLHAAGSHLPAPRDVARARGSGGRLDGQSSRAGAPIRRV